MRDAEDFEEFLQRDLLPATKRWNERVRALAERRQAARLPGSTKAVIFVIGFVLAGLLRSAEVFLLALAGPFVLDAFRMLEIRDPGVEAGRRELVRRAIGFWDPSFQHEAGRGVPSEEVRRSLLFREAYELCSGEDFVSGKVGATAFHFSEIRFKKLVDRKKGRYETVWSGLFFVADSPKAFSGRTILEPDAAERALGRVGRAFQGMGRAEKLVQLEDPEFERHFAVYSTDEIEARYLLSPSLMQRILRFRQNTNAALRISFVGGAMHLALPLAQDLFDASGTIDETRLRTWAGQILFATGIVEDLDLNTRIWSKPSA